MNHHPFSSALQQSETPCFEHGRMIIGLTGWMNGGDVSTGTVETLVSQLHSRQVGHIEASPFYLCNFPGTMEISAIFRPHVEIRDGMVTEYVEPQNYFFADNAHQLLFFLGREPNIHWHEYTKCVFSMAQRYQVKEIVFIGSVSGLTPHTREPRVVSTVSHEDLKERLNPLNIKYANYEGPGSIINLFMQYAQRLDIRMASLIAEIPPYIEGRNPKCIEAMVKRLSGLFGFEMDLTAFRVVAEAFEKKITEAVENNEELIHNIQVLEENYDQEVFDTEMGDLKSWLQQQGIRLD